MTAADTTSQTETSLLSPTSCPRPLLATAEKVCCRLQLCPYLRHAWFVVISVVWLTTDDICDHELKAVEWTSCKLKLANCSCVTNVVCGDWNLQLSCLAVGCAACVCSTMTMEELLTHLINKTKYDCEEAHRRMVFASTGLAGLHIIKHQVHRDSSWHWTLMFWTAFDCFALWIILWLC